MHFQHFADNMSLKRMNVDNTDCLEKLGAIVDNVLQYLTNNDTELQPGVKVLFSRNTIDITVSPEHFQYSSDDIHDAVNVLNIYFVSRGWQEFFFHEHKINYTFILSMRVR